MSAAHTEWGIRWQGGEIVKLHSDEQYVRRFAQKYAAGDPNEEGRALAVCRREIGEWVEVAPASEGPTS